MSAKDGHVGATGWQAWGTTGAFIALAALVIAPGCSSSSTSSGEDAGASGGDGGTRSDGGASASDAGADGRAPEVTDSGDTSCYSSSDSKTYQDGETGCSGVYKVAICDKGTWQLSHTCSGSGCYCDFGRCVGSRCE